MSYILESSLEKRALVKISSILWNQNDIRALVKEYSPCFDIFEWKKVEEKVIEKVIEKVQMLPQPKLVKEKISGYVRPMGRQIFKWIDCHSRSTCVRNCYLNVHIPAEFSWTPHGTIDKKETAKIIIKDHSVDPATRYELAYIYCLEGNVQNVWNSIPEEYKDPIYKTRVSPGFINEQDLRFVWANLAYPHSEQYDTDSYENAFQNAIRCHNKVAAQYFLKKVTPKERERCLKKYVQAAHVRCLPEVEMLCFLLSQMDEEQQMRVFRSNPDSVISTIFDWPWMTFFVETASRYWDSLSSHEKWFSPLIALINSKINNGYEDDIYREIFRELWLCARNRFGVDVCVNSSNSLLSRLFDVKDKDIIGLIYQDASPAIKEHFILSDTGLYISTKLVKENDHELLEFFIRGCLTSEDQIKEYKEKIKQCTVS